MQNIRNIDVLASMKECADNMLHDIDDEETMFEGFATLHRLCFMLPQDLIMAFSSIADLSEAIDSAEEVFLTENDDEVLIFGLAKIYAYGSSSSQMYKMLASPAFTEGFIPVTI